jgi:hypothetical protein
MASPIDKHSRTTGLGRLLLVYLTLLPCCFAARAQEQQPAAEIQRNPAQMILFHQHPEDYKGGKQLAVTVYISAFQWDGLTAMGLYETVPEGWTFRAARAITGTMPSVLPAEGASGTLQFLWIEQSTAPITFQYVLDVPARDSGLRYLSGQVEYRQGEGALTSNVAFSQLTGLADELPVISLQGTAGINIALNATFNDPGATATDAEDGDLSNQIEVAGAVDTSEPGTYTLTYGVTDSVGNRAVPVSRQVTVSDTPNDAGGGTPDGEKPDTGGNPGLAGGEALPPIQMAARRPESAKPSPQITVPGITLRENSGEYKLPLKSTNGGEETPDDEIAPETGAGGADAFRSTQTAGLVSTSREESSNGAPGLGGGGPGDDFTDAALAQSPRLLIAVATLLVVALIGLGYRARKPARRIR